jgi:hypothetical protein
MVGQAAVFGVDDRCAPASITSPSVSSALRPRKNPLPADRTGAPVSSTSLSMASVWSLCR